MIYFKSNEYDITNNYNCRAPAISTSQLRLLQLCLCSIASIGWEFSDSDFSLVTTRMATFIRGGGIKFQGRLMTGADVPPGPFTNPILPSCGWKNA